MSQESVSSPLAGTAGGLKINPDPLVFFQTILVNMTNRPEVDWSIVAKKVGYNTAETAKARFRQMKRKFNDAHSDRKLVSSPPMAQISASKVIKNTKAITSRSPAKAIKPKPLPARAKNNGREKAPVVEKKAKRVKLEKAEAGNDADGETESSFAEFGDIESE